MTAGDLLDARVSDVLAGNPAAARVFLGHGMNCPGCTFAPFETVSEAAQAYGIDPHELAARLAAAHDFTDAHVREELPR